MSKNAETESAPRIPRHVAIIMDGNGRWARQKGVPHLRGHREGAESLRAIVKACKKLGVKILTVYAFSTENWRRPKREVSGLMKLLVTYLRNQEHELHDNRIRLRHIGRLQDLAPAVRAELVRVMKATESYSDGQLILALSYGGREEIAHAASCLAADVKAGKLAPNEIDEQALSARLYVPDVPDPDLMIRTSGEMRLSNFLLWQLSYAELYVTDTLWPDFREEEFRLALAEYGKRQRRFGGQG